MRAHHDFASCGSFGQGIRLLAKRIFHRAGNRGSDFGAHAAGAVSANQTPHLAAETGPAGSRSARASPFEIVGGRPNPRRASATRRMASPGAGFDFSIEPSRCADTLITVSSNAAHHQK